jgi:hypothetical protein
MKTTQQTVMNGLNTDTFKVGVAGLHSIYVRSNVNQGSSVVITISQSGSTSSSFTTPATSATTNHVELNGKFNCAVNDILTVAVTSSAAADQPPSLVKTTINLRQGAV